MKLSYQSVDQVVYFVIAKCCEVFVIKMASKMNELRPKNVQILH